MDMEIVFLPLHRNTALIVTKEKQKTFTHIGSQITVQEKHRENELSLAFTHHFRPLSLEYLFPNMILHQH